MQFGRPSPATLARADPPQTAFVEGEVGCRRGGSESGAQAEGVWVELTHKLGAGRLGARAAGSVFGEKACEKTVFG